MDALDRLTERERKIVSLVVAGQDYKAIAAAVGLSRSTLKYYISRLIYPKLGVRDKASLVRWWFQEVEGRRCEDCLLRRALIDAGCLPQESKRADQK